MSNSDYEPVEATEDYSLDTIVIEDTQIDPSFSKKHISAPQNYSTSEVIQCLNRYIMDPSRVDSPEYLKDSELLCGYVMSVLEGIAALLEKKPDINYINSLLAASKTSRPQLNNLHRAFCRKCWDAKVDPKEKISYLISELRYLVKKRDDLADIEEIRDFFAFVELYESSAVTRLF